MRAFPKGAILFAFVSTGFVLHGAACGRSTCIVVPREVYEKSGCPTKEKALLMLDVCGTEIYELLGEGEYNGQTCCYPATYGEPRYDTCGFEESSGSSGGFGGSGGAPGCVTCSEVLFDGFSPELACPGAFESFSGVQSCGCSLCVEACDFTLCSGDLASQECFSCLMGSCPSEVELCSL